MLVRDAPAPSGGTTLEVLMVRRNLRSDFVGGAYVFPGGAVDLLDGGAEAESLLPAGATPRPARSWASNRAASPTGSAVVRETFEEAGLLLAEREGGPDLLAGDPEEEARFAAARDAVNAGTLASSTCAGRSVCSSRRERHRLLRALDHAARCPLRYRHPLLRGRGAAGQIAPRRGETIADVRISPS